ncbi:troponin T, cardiac muscle isoforms isoform X2 [Ananas comosus]|uniref:Troponin T, cardiac muscle isoforms isoform X2 n=1 Tax=Ananas comosus TaxID=4615 RepID=A0A6P5FSB5_ANACO|nr:troponin T, cardiac muscle isoforms isoform X2 [Ananas comosus]
MIKRRFYKQDHDGDKGGSSSSDSSSDSDSACDTTTKEEEEEEAEEEEEEDELKDEGEQEAQEEEGEQERDGDQRPFSPSPGSGYESEDSSENVLDGNCSAVDEEDGFDSGRGNHQNRPFIRNIRDGESNCLDAARNSPNINDPSDPDFASFILKCKSVFKCRLCPRIICLSEETVRAHLTSKRHARSKKLLGEGRLKLMLNSDGELEEDQETHAERHARTIALAQEPLANKKKDTGRQRQSRRRKKRLRNHSEKQAEGPMNDHIKRRCKAEEQKIK